MTVLAAFKVLLAKYSSRDDLVVGTPSSGRHRPELQGNTIGCFVNLTALRTSLAGKVLCIMLYIGHVKLCGLPVIFQSQDPALNLWSSGPVSIQTLSTLN